MRISTRNVVLAGLLPAVVALAVSTVLGCGRGSPAGSLSASEPSGVEGERQRADLLARLAQAVESSDGRLVRGRDGWLFLPSEIRALSARPGAPANAAPGAQEAAAPPGGSAGIREFQQELASQGVELLVVLVPPKVAVYPELLLPDLPQRIPRLDVAAQAVLTQMEQWAIPAVDLLPRFLREKGGDLDDPLYVPTDSHWSSRGCRLAAEEIASRVKALWPSLLAGTPGSQAQTTIATEPFPIGSDLRALLPAAEQLDKPTMLFHRIAADAAARAPEAKEILLVGDSHLLVWRGRQGGLTDHLQRALGLSLSQVAVQAGGPTVSRQALARREGALAGRKLVIWVFAARLLESPPAQMPLPAATSSAPRASP
ncbi:MAG: hypothetical protein KBA72_12305 [Thermoanaerobaculia bacterium]|nr:hypothetical protein [Thermoanaerobaculia bacterium]